MKSFATLFSVALGASGASAAILSDSAAPPVSSVLASSSGIVSVSTLSAPPTSTVPTPTGGYVVTGIYTTCLTLTFASPVSTGTSATATASGSVSVSSAPGVTSFTGSTFSEPIPTLSDTLSFAGGPGATIIPVPDEAVFTTCLAFLATPTATATTTFTDTPTGFPSAAESASAAPSASISVV
ncbi:hypothetical protein B0H14DRAFT_1125540 [Mycena olivaceomarginata]|nr:hypothetical protein B0H14DRAFT_1125540 [Mycena olivaceomarginata]